MQSNRDSHALLVETQNGTATLENSLEVFFIMLNIYLPTVVHLYSFILLSNSNKLLIRAIIWMNFKNIILRESSQTQKATILHYSIHVTFRKRQKTAGKRSERSCAGLSMEEGWLQRGMGASWEWWKCSPLRRTAAWVCQNPQNFVTLNYTEKNDFCCMQMYLNKKKIKLKKGSRREVRPMVVNQGITVE